MSTIIGSRPDCCSRRSPVRARRRERRSPPSASSRLLSAEARRGEVRAHAPAHADADPLLNLRRAGTRPPRTRPRRRRPRRRRAVAVSNVADGRQGTTPEGAASLGRSWSPRARCPRLLALCEKCEEPPRRAALVAVSSPFAGYKRQLPSGFQPLRSRASGIVRRPESATCETRTGEEGSAGLLTPRDRRADCSRSSQVSPGVARQAGGCRESGCWRPSVSRPCRRTGHPHDVRSSARCLALRLHHPTLKTRTPSLRSTSRPAFRRRSALPCHSR